MAKVKKKSKSSSKTLKVDFSGVDKEVRRRNKKIPEGDYLFKVTKGEVKKNKDGKGRHIVFTLQVVENAKGSTKQKGVPLWYRCSLKPDALFNLRNFIFAATDGKKNVAGKKAVDIKIAKYIGAKIAGTVEDDEYDGKIKSNIADVFPPSQLVEDDEDEEDDEDDEDEDEDDDDDEDDEDEEDDDDDEDEDDDEDDEDEDDLDDVDEDDV